MKFPAFVLPLAMSTSVLLPVHEVGASPISSVDRWPTVTGAGPVSSLTNGPPNAVRRPATAIAYAKVVLSEQKAYFYNSRRRLIATVPISTGLDDTTPVGRFRVFSKSQSTYYAPDPAEKMRWMTRFTRGRRGGNIGFHSVPYRIIDGAEVASPTPLGQAPSSHGCIRVSNSDAQWIFENMAIGTVVTVVPTR